MNRPPPFGRLLRFWRRTFDLSQESLALTVGISPRHLSFLENGRSRPGQSLIKNIAQALQLSHRDTGNLLVAAGYLPDDNDPLGGTEQRWLHKSAAMRLRDLDPTPAWLADPYGNISMVNRGWLYLNPLHPDEQTDPLQMNAYHRYFLNSGLRDQLVNWEDLACALLLNLQQEVLLTGDDTAQSLLTDLLRYPGIPHDWQRRAALIPYAQSFKIQRRGTGGQIETFIAINTTVGATPYVSQPRLILSALHPIVANDWIELQDIAHLDHPMLFTSYQ